jgi:hypothetical protein
MPVPTPRDPYLADCEGQFSGGDGSKLAKSEIGLPSLNTYRTMCLVPKPEFRRLLEEIRQLPLAA